MYMLMGDQSEVNRCNLHAILFVSPLCWRHPEHSIITMELGATYEPCSVYIDGCWRNGACVGITRRFGSGKLIRFVVRPSLCQREWDGRL